jgi:hypothetical protein
MREGRAITTATFLPFVVLVVVIVVIVFVIVARYARDAARHHKGVCCDGKQVDEGVALASADTQRWLGGEYERGSCALSLNIPCIDPSSRSSITRHAL